MITAFGIGFVMVAVLTGFSMAGGHIHSLIHPSELVTIGGCAVGALIASSPKAVLMNVVKGLIGLLKGAGPNKKTYLDVFGVLFEFFRIGRQDGLLAWENILSDSHSNPIFDRFPKVGKNHHLAEFIKGALVAAGDGTCDGPELKRLLETEIETLHHEHHAAVAALTRTADGLPGFGIVAAVLGIVVTMGAISGPVEVIGEKVGAALVGTFLGILLSYGVIAPVAGRMEADGEAESSLLKMIAWSVATFVDGATPRVVLEKARRQITSDCRPTVKEMDEIVKAPPIPR